MDVFLSISNINSIISPDEVPKNRCGWQTGNKEMINVGLTTPLEVRRVGGLDTRMRVYLGSCQLSLDSL